MSIRWCTGRGRDQRRPTNHSQLFSCDRFESIEFAKKLCDKEFKKYSQRGQCERKKTNRNNANTFIEIILSSENFVSGKNMKNLTTIWSNVCQVVRNVVQMFINRFNKCCDRIKSIEWINVLYSYLVSSIIFDYLDITWNDICNHIINPERVIIQSTSNIDANQI